MNVQLKSGLREILVFFLLFLMMAGSLRPDKIKIKKENGVTVIYNPKKPSPPPGMPTELILKEDLSIGVKEGQEEYMFLDPVDMDVDDKGNIYVLDRKAFHIKVFDKDGQFVRTIGKKGQGPGEVQRPRDIDITPQEELLINDMSARRLLFFSLEGDFLKEASAGKMWLFVDPKADSEGNVIASYIIMAETPSHQLKKFNSMLEPILDIFTLELAKPPAIDTRFPRIYWEILEGNFLVWGAQSKYILHILDSRGKEIRKIVKDYDPVEFTKADKDKVLERGLYEGPDVKLLWSKHHLAFMEFTCDDQGRIFVRTHEKTKDGKSHFYDIFDPEGRYIAKVPLEVRPKVWKKKKMYIIYEDEEGYRFVKRYAVDWK